MATATPAKPRAALGTTKKKFLEVVARANAMYVALLAAAATFSSPPIALAAFLVLIQAVEAAQAQASTKALGTAAARTVKVDPLWNAMLSLRLYVQTMADQLDYNAAVALIQQAGLLLSAAQAHMKELLTAELVTATNMVLLMCNETMLCGKTHKKTIFHWQMSSDNKTWTNLTSTNYATTTLPNPGPGTWYFRVSAVVGRTAIDWTQSVSLTLH
jgi:hypothetical protein